MKSTGDRSSDNSQEEKCDCDDRDDIPERQFKLQALKAKLDLAKLIAKLIFLAFIWFLWYLVETH